MNRRAILRFAVIAALDVFLLAMMITACVTAGHMMDDLDEAGKLAASVGGMVGIALWLFMLMVFVNLYDSKCDLERRVKKLERDSRDDQRRGPELRDDQDAFHRSMLRLRGLRHRHGAHSSQPGVRRVADRLCRDRGLCRGRDVPQEINGKVDRSEEGERMTIEEDRAMMQGISAFYTPFILVGIAIGFVAAALIVTVSADWTRAYFVLAATGVFFLMVACLSMKRSKRTVERIVEELREKHGENGDV